MLKTLTFILGGEKKKGFAISKKKNYNNIAIQEKFEKIKI